MQYWNLTGGGNVIDIFSKTVSRFSNKEAIVFEGKSLTFKQLDQCNVYIK